MAVHVYNVVFKFLHCYLFRLAKAPQVTLYFLVVKFLHFSVLIQLAQRVIELDGVLTEHSDDVA